VLSGVLAFVRSSQDHLIVVGNRKNAMENEDSRSALSFDEQVEQENSFDSDNDNDAVMVDEDDLENEIVLSTVMSAWVSHHFWFHF
jgi:hypothetical protein